MSIPLVGDEEEDEENVESEEGGEIFCVEELVMEIASCVRLPNMGSSLILTLIVNKKKKLAGWSIEGNSNYTEALPQHKQRLKKGRRSHTKEIIFLIYFSLKFIGTGTSICTRYLNS